MDVALCVGRMAEVFTRYWYLSVGSVCVEISFYLAIVEMDLCI